MKNGFVVLACVAIVGCGGASGSSLGFDASGASAAHVDADGEGSSNGVGAYVLASGWTLSVNSHGWLMLRAPDGMTFSTDHGGVCNVSLDAEVRSGTFECTGLSSQAGATIDVKNGYFTAAPAASAGGGAEESDPCKWGLPDLYCSR